MGSMLHDILIRILISLNTQYFEKSLRQSIKGSHKTLSEPDFLIFAKG